MIDEHQDHLNCGSCELTEKINSKLLNHEMIEKALEKSPSGGNTKPFQWSWSKNKLSILHDLKLASHYLNRNQHTSWLALGCMIKSVEIAANDQGWETSVKISKELDAEISFFQSSRVGLKKFNLSDLLNRTTYRGSFKPSPEPQTLPSQLPGIQVNMASANFLHSEFKKFITSSDFYLWIQKKAMLAFFKEIRFFDHRISPRGIRSEDLGVGIFDQITLYFFSFVPWLLSLFIRVPILNLNFFMASKRNIKNAHYILISAKELDSQSLVRAGQEAMSLWLKLEEQGYKVQPCSTASITLVDAANNCLPEDTNQTFRDLFSVTGPKILKQQFNLGSVEKPVWLFRVGKS